MKKNDIIKHRNGSIGVLETDPSSEFFNKFYGEGHGIEAAKIKWISGKLANRLYSPVEIETVTNTTDRFKAQVIFATPQEIESIKDKLPKQKLKVQDKFIQKEN